MSNKVLGYLLAVLIASLLLVPVLKAETIAYGAYGLQATALLAERSMYILAVAQEDGKYVGVPSVLTVKVTRGSGMVYVSAMPLSEVDIQASARIAAVVASYIAGTNYFSYDYFISIKANTTIIGGPSAGAAMTVALVAALLGKPINRSIVITGMILPDGTIGAVGGIPEKLDAAAEVGAKVMLIPLGQAESLSLASGKYVNVVELGRRKGVKVVEVATVYDALKWFGINVSRPTPREYTLPESVVGIVKSWILKFKNSYLSTREKLLKLLGKLPGSSDDVEKFLSDAEKYASRGEQDVSAGMYYSAASDYFVASINADAALWLAKIKLGSTSIGELISEARSRVSLAKNKYEQLVSAVGPEVDVSELAILTEVASRVAEAEESLSSLEKEVQNKSLSSVVWDAVYVIWRAESALDWMKVIDSVGKSGIPVRLDDVREAATVLIYYARTSASYIESLTGFLGASSILQSVEKAERYLTTDIFMALALATWLVAQITSTLDSVFTKNVSTIAEVLRNESLVAIATCIRSGFTPISALAYVERGDSMRGYSYAEAIYFYELALVATRGYLIIASQKSPAQTVQPEMPTATQVKSTYPSGAAAHLSMVWVTVVYALIIALSAVVVCVVVRALTKVK